MLYVSLSLIAICPLQLWHIFGTLLIHLAFYDCPLPLSVRTLKAGKNSRFFVRIHDMHLLHDTYRNYASNLPSEHSERCTLFKRLLHGIFDSKRAEISVRHEPVL